MAVLEHSGTVVRSPRARAIAERLAGLISCGTYLLHHRLPPERQLCEQLGVTRAMLRKALFILSEEGVIWRHVGKGTYVGGSPTGSTLYTKTLSTRATLSELIEARLFIEPIVARLAADRATVRDLSLMEKYYQKAAEAHDWDGWDDWDDSFHRSIAESTGNAVMIGLIDSLLQIKRDSKWCIRRAKTFDPALVAYYSTHHRRIVFCVMKRQPARAELAMREHIAGIATSLGPTLSH